MHDVTAELCAHELETAASIALKDHMPGPVLDIKLPPMFGEQAKPLVQIDPQDEEAYFSLETAASTALKDCMLRPVLDIKLPLMFDEHCKHDVPIDTHKEEAYFSAAFNGNIIINDLGGNNHRQAGVGFDDPNLRFDDDHGAPGHDGDPCDDDYGHWNQEERILIR